MRMTSHPAIGAASVLAAMALVVLDAGITNVALPTMSTSFGIPPSEAILVTSVYQLALLMGLLPAAHISARTGTRALFALGLGVFCCASVLAAMAPTFSALVIARYVQGLGGSAVLALGIPLMKAALGRDRLGSAIAWNALNVAICAAAGPALGAFVLSVAGWPWLFLLNVPIGMFAIGASRALPYSGTARSKIDAVSIVLHVVTVAIVFGCLDNLASNRMVSAALAPVAALSLLLLWRRELPKFAPLLPLDLLRERSFRLAALASTICFVAQCAGLVALPFYLQHNLAANALVSGAVIACWPLAAAATSQIANILVDRIPTSALCAAGMATFSAGMSAMALLEPSIGLVALCAAICGLGFGLFQVPNNQNMFLAAPEHRSEAAGGMQGTARLAGQLVGGVLASQIFILSPGLAAPKLVMALASSFALIAAIVSALRNSSTRRHPIFCEA